MTSSQPSAIDAVVTWVDSSDERWRESFRQYAPVLQMRTNGPDGPRFRDGGLLKFCLRAINDNLPWIRNVYLVTEGHKPDFIKSSSSNLKFVCHADIFQDRSHLPTFNSMAIESHLHRIKGLSRFFVYFNDDVFVTREVQKSTFMDGSTGHILPFENFPLPMDMRSPDVVDRSLAFTNLLLSTRFGTKVTRCLIPHMPQVFDKLWLEHLWSVWRNEFTRTSAARFRQTDNIAMRALYYHAIHEWPPSGLPEFANDVTYPVRIYGAPSYRFVWTRGGVSPLRASLQSLDDDNLIFLCLNDDTLEPSQAAEQHQVITEQLERRFPIPAPWERR